MKKLKLIFLLILICCVSINIKSQEEDDDVKSLAPFVPTPMEVVERMLKLANVKKTDVVYDLGCGDGRIVVMAAEKFKAKGIGVDYNEERVLESRELVKKKKVEKLVKIIHQDAMTVDLSPATVVTLYLFERSNVLLQPNLEKYLNSTEEKGLLKKLL